MHAYLKTMWVNMHDTHDSGLCLLWNLAAIESCVEIAFARESWKVRCHTRSVNVHSCTPVALAGKDVGNGSALSFD